MCGRSQGHPKLTPQKCLAGRKHHDVVNFPEKGGKKKQMTKTNIGEEGMSRGDPRNNFLSQASSFYNMERRRRG